MDKGESVPLLKNAKKPEIRMALFDDMEFHQFCVSEINTELLANLFF